MERIKLHTNSLQHPNHSDSLCYVSQVVVQSDKPMGENKLLNRQACEKQLSAYSREGIAASLEAIIINASSVRRKFR